MSSRFLLHIIFLSRSVAGVYLWITPPTLARSTLQLVAVLVILYLGTHWLRARHPKWFHKSTITLDITILTSMILLLVVETGSLASPLFFLLYFLLFAVAMLYEIEATLVLTGVAILFFLFLPGTNLNDLAHLSELVALVMITPLAIFTGHQYEQTVEERKAAQTLANHMSTEETDTLLFLSLNLKRTLLDALDSLSVTIPLTRVKDVRTNLQSVYSDLKNLYRSADELQQTIDRESDQD